jgi:hypothetical protein
MTGITVSLPNKSEIVSEHDRTKLAKIIEIIKSYDESLLFDILGYSWQFFAIHWLQDAMWKLDNNNYWDNKPGEKIEDTNLELYNNYYCISELYGSIIVDELEKHSNDDKEEL